ncbi:hypothetical protein ACNOYE_25145 [Nannocystaceae bacterium ST9]
MRLARASMIVMIVMFGACTAKPDSPPPTAEQTPEPAKPEPREPKPSKLEPSKPEPPAPTKIEPAASFEDRFGGLWVDIGKDVALAPEGGYVLVGRSQRVDDRYDDDYQLAVIVLDAAGERRWSQDLGPEATYQAGAGVVADDQGLTIAGTSDAGGAGDDVWIVRLDWRGETKWTKTLGGEADEFARAIAPAPAGGWLVVGGRKLGEARDAMAWRIGASGDEFFSKTLGGTGDDVASGLVQSGDGWVVVGSSSSPEIASAGQDDGWILRLDSRGETSWSHAHGGPQTDRLFALAASEGGWIAVGESDGRAWVLWTDGEGKQVDQRSLVPGVLLDVAAQPSGAVVGGIRDEGLPEAWLAWLAPDRTQARERKFGFDRNAVEALIPTPDGGLLLTGNWATINSNYGNIWACKLDAKGEGC